MTQTLTVEFTPWLSRTLHLCAFPDVNVVFAFLHGSHVGSLVGSHVGIHVATMLAATLASMLAAMLASMLATVYERNVVSVFL